MLSQTTIPSNMQNISQLESPINSECLPNKSCKGILNHNLSINVHTYGMCCTFTSAGAPYKSVYTQCTYVIVLLRRKIGHMHMLFKVAVFPLLWSLGMLTLNVKYVVKLSVKIHAWRSVTLSASWHPEDQLLLFLISWAMFHSSGTNSPTLSFEKRSSKRTLTVN